MYFLLTDNGRDAITLTDRIGGGLEADIYRIKDLRAAAAKIYKVSQPAARRSKLEAMLQYPLPRNSQNVGGRQFLLYAWPTHLIVHDNGSLAGFVMPEIAKPPAISLTKYMCIRDMRKSLSADDRSLPRRLAIARNIAACVAELHAHGHLIVDLKPANLCLYPETGLVCLLDTDGCAISSGPQSTQRFPACTWTDMYQAPELLRARVKPNAIDNDEHDRFCLAVLIFQLFNRGIHPYQGRYVTKVHDQTISNALLRGDYAYGITASDVIAPSKNSVHHCLPEKLRELFDQSFQAAPADRPTAKAWRVALDGLLSEKRHFQRCDEHPDAVDHIHFSGFNCAECLHPRPAPEPPVGNTLHLSTRPPELPPPPPYIWLAIVVIAVLVIIYFAFQYFNTP